VTHAVGATGDGGADPKSAEAALRSIDSDAGSGSRRRWQGGAWQPVV